MRLALILGAAPSVGKVTGSVRVEAGTWILRHNIDDSIIDFMFEYPSSGDSPVIIPSTLVQLNDPYTIKVINYCYVRGTFKSKGKERYINAFLERIAD